MLPPNRQRGEVLGFQPASQPGQKRETLFTAEGLLCLYDGEERGGDTSVGGEPLTCGRGDAASHSSTIVSSQWYYVVFFWFALHPRMKKIHIYINRVWKSPDNKEWWVCEVNLTKRRFSSSLSSRWGIFLSSFRPLYRKWWSMVQINTKLF